MTFEEWWKGPREVPQTEYAAIEAFNAGASSRDAEVADLKQTCIDHVEIQNALREQVTLLRDALDTVVQLNPCLWSHEKAQKTLAATEQQK